MAPAKKAAEKTVAPKGAAPDVDEANAEPDQPEIKEIGSNADDLSPEEAAKAAPEDEPTMPVNEEGSEDLDVAEGPQKDSVLQAAADEVAPERNYAEQDRLIAEATAPEVDNERAARQQAAGVAAAEQRVAAREVVQFNVRFNAAAIPVVIDSISGPRALATARMFLHELADSPDVTVTRLDGKAVEEEDEVDPNAE